MDTLVIMNKFPYILPFLIILISMFLFLFNFRKPKANVPPGSGGWPVVGENIKFVLSGPQEFIKERTKKYSQDVFQTSLFAQKLAVFCGPQGNKFLFGNETKSLTSWWPLSVRKVLFFPEVAGSSHDDTASLMLCFMGEILKPQALKQYVPVMDSRAREHVELEWVGNEVVKVYPVSKKYTFDLACRVIMSVVDAEHVTRLTKYFINVNAGLFSVPVDLPGTAYNKAINDGKLVRAELMKIITKRIKEMVENKLETASKSDFLSRILQVTDKDGELVSEKEITNNIVSYLYSVI